MNQRVIKHIGTAPSEEHLEKIIKLANVIKEMFLQNISTKQIEIYHKQEINKINGTGNLIQNCVPVKRIAKGIQDIYGKIFDAMGLNQIIVSKTNYAEIIRNIVIGRIACLGSKRKTCEQLEKKFNKKYSLSALYRAMDKLTAETIELIQTQICNYNKNLLNNEIKVLFYDATTIYFESFNDEYRYGTCYYCRTDHTIHMKALQAKHFLYSKP